MASSRNRRAKTSTKPRAPAKAPIKTPVLPPLPVEPPAQTKSVSPPLSLESPAQTNPVLPSIPFIQPMTFPYHAITTDTTEMNPREFTNTAPATAPNTTGSTISPMVRIHTVPMKGTEVWKSRYDFKMFSRDDDEDGEVGSEKWGIGANDDSQGRQPMTEMINGATFDERDDAEAESDNDQVKKPEWVANERGLNIDVISFFAPMVIGDAGKRRTQDVGEPDVVKRRRAEGNVAYS